MTARRWWRPALLVGLVAGLAVTGYAAHPQHLVSAAGRLGVPAAVALASALLLALVPRTVISLACGALFGALVGSGAALAAALISASLGFALARWLAREAVATRVRGRLARLDGWLHRRGLLAVVVVRLLPVAPFGLVSYGYGTTSVRTRHYLAGTLLGAAPSAATYAGIGAAATAPHGITPLSLAPAGLGLLVSATALLLGRRTRQRAAPDRPPGPVPAGTLPAGGVQLGPPPAGTPAAASRPR